MIHSDTKYVAPFHRATSGEVVIELAMEKTTHLERYSYLHRDYPQPEQYCQGQADASISRHAVHSDYSILIDAYVPIAWLLFLGIRYLRKETSVIGTGDH